jgi:hypothetical protein
MAAGHRVVKRVTARWTLGLPNWFREKAGACRASPLL